jgi:hypothetical protein
LESQDRVKAKAAAKAEKTNGVDGDENHHEQSDEVNGGTSNGHHKENGHTNGHTE